MESQNGTVAKSLKEVRRERMLLEEQVKLTRLQGQQKALAQRAKLVESWYGGWDEYNNAGGYAGSTLFDRVRGRDEHDRQRVAPSVPSDRRHGENWPIYRTEQELAEFRAASRILCEDNGYARGLLRNLTNYVIEKGYTYTAQSKEGVPDADEKVPGKQDPGPVKKYEDRAQKWFDRWAKRVKWPSRQREAFRRTNRDGEAFIRLFFNDDGTTDLRFVEPEQVRNPPGGTVQDGWSFGIRHKMTPAEDVETIEEYYVLYQDASTAKNGQELGEYVPASEMVHVKSPDTDSNLKRGHPVFYGDTLNALHRASQLQRAISIGSAVRAATAEYWVYEFGTESQIGQIVAGQREYERTDPVTGRAEQIERKVPGTTRHLPDGIKPYWPPGVTGVTDHIQAGQADLRLAGTAFSVPEFMVSGDASNSNLASTLVASAPVTRAAETDQEHYEGPFLDIIDRSAVHAVEKGKLPSDLLDLVEFVADPPKVIHRDAMQTAHVDQIYVMMGAKDRQTVAAELGLDWEQVKTNNAEWEELYPSFHDTIPPFAGKGGGAGGSGERAPPGMGAGTQSMMTSREVMEADGTCKAGERADLTGCSPATTDAAQSKEAPSADPIKAGLSSARDIYDNSLKMSYEQVDAAVADRLGGMDAKSIRQVAVAFDIFDAPRSKTGALQAISQKIKDRITFHARAGTEPASAGGGTDLKSLWAAGPKNWAHLSGDQLDKTVHDATANMSPGDTAQLAKDVLDRPDKKFKNKEEAVEFLRSSFRDRKGAFVRVNASRETEQEGDSFFG
jgi:lambda family portal protein